MKKVKLNILRINRHLEKIITNTGRALFNHLAMVVNLAWKNLVCGIFRENVIPGITVDLVCVADKGIADKFCFVMTALTDLCYEVGDHGCSNPRTVPGHELGDFVRLLTF